MEDEEIQERQRSYVAPFIFMIIVAFQFAYYCLDHLNKISSSFFEPDQTNLSKLFISFQPFFSTKTSFN